MLHTDARFSELVEAEVSAIEAKTDAEVVVVATSRSSSYADLRSHTAAGGALVAFLVLLLIPMEISPVLAVVDLVIAWFATYWLSSSALWLRFLASQERQEQEVALAAAAEFHLEAVHSTPGRLALLIYVSALEGRVELIPDVGLEARIPRGRWVDAATEFAHDDLDHFMAGLRKAGELLAEEVPQTQPEDRLDLPNAPRIRG